MLLFVLDFWSSVVIGQILFFADSGNHIQIKAFKVELNAR